MSMREWTGGSLGVKYLVEYPDRDDRELGAAVRVGTRSGRSGGRRPSRRMVDQFEGPARLGRQGSGWCPSDLHAEIQRSRHSLRVSSLGDR